MCRVKPYYTHTHTCWCVRRPRCQMSINMQSRRPTASLHGINAALPLLPPRSTIPPTRRTSPVPMPRPHTRVHKYTSRTDYPYTLFCLNAARAPISGLLTIVYVEHIRRILPASVNQTACLYSGGLCCVVRRVSS